MANSGAGTDLPGNGQEAEGGSEWTREHPPEWYADQYEKLQPEFTRRSQSLAETQERAQQYEELFEALNDPEQAQEILAELGYELESGSDEGQGPEGEDFEFVDPLEQKVAELEQLAEYLQSEREQEAQSAEEAALMDMRDDYIDNAIDFLKNQEDTPELSEQEEEILGNLAIAMTDEEGVPDVLGAYNRLYGEDGLLETNRSRWIQSKTGAITAPLGSSGSSERRPTNRRERVAFLDARMRALDADQ